MFPLLKKNFETQTSKSSKQMHIPLFFPNIKARFNSRSHITLCKISYARSQMQDLISHFI